MLLGQMDLLAQLEMDGGDAAAGAAAAGALGMMTLVQAAIGLLVIAAYWKIFSKAGKPGWAAIIPIYNLVVLLEIVGRPIWWIILLCVPCVNVVILIILMVDLAKSYGKDGAFAAGLILLGVIFLPILGFGSAQYQGPAALAGGAPAGGGGGAPAGGGGGAPAGGDGGAPAGGDGGAPAGGDGGAPPDSGGAPGEG